MSRIGEIKRIHERDSADRPHHGRLKQVKGGWVDVTTANAAHRHRGELLAEVERLQKERKRATDEREWCLSQIYNAALRAGSTVGPPDPPHGVEPQSHWLDELNKCIDTLKQRLAEVEKRAHRWDAIREYVDAHGRVGSFWCWMGDGSDKLETLSCPVLIFPDALRRIIKQADDEHERVRREVEANLKLHDELKQCKAENERLREVVEAATELHRCIDVSAKRGWLALGPETSQVMGRVAATLASHPTADPDWRNTDDGELFMDHDGVDRFATAMKAQAGRRQVIMENDNQQDSYENADPPEGYRVTQANLCNPTRQLWLAKPEGSREVILPDGSCRLGTSNPSDDEHPTRAAAIAACWAHKRRNEPSSRHQENGADDTPAKPMPPEGWRLKYDEPRVPHGSESWLAPRTRQLRHADDPQHWHDNEPRWIVERIPDEQPEQDQAGPCPWCGSGVLLQDAETWNVVCASEACEAAGPMRDTVSEAIAAWNKIAKPAPLPDAERARVRAEVVGKLYEDAIKKRDEATDPIVRFHYKRVLQWLGCVSHRVLKEADRAEKGGGE